MRARAWRGVALASRVLLIAGAAWALHRELADTSASALLGHLRAYGLNHVVLAVGCTVVSFLLLGVVELLALRVCRIPRDTVSRTRVLLTAFVANALSQSVGLAVLTGSAVRHRAYTRFGVGKADVARVSTFITLTATVGLLAAGGWALVASPAGSGIEHVALPLRALGVACLAVVAAYLAWSALGGGEASGRWRIPRPTLPTALGQLMLSASDWVLTGAVLWMFLPASLGIRFWVLMRTYLVAQTAGVTSHVPGGVGVMEVVLIGLLPIGSAEDRAAVVAALVMFRVVYYLLPLAGAVVAGGVTEIARRGARGG